MEMENKNKLLWLCFAILTWQTASVIFIRPFPLLLGHNGANKNVDAEYTRLLSIVLQNIFI